MPEEEVDNEDELSYMEEYQLDEQEYRDVRKPITVAYIKLKESWDSRTYILQKLEEIKDKFYEELLNNKFISDLPVVVLFERFLENYDEYKLKWEETVEAYNTAMKNVVDSVDANYIHKSAAGKSEKEKIAQLKLEIQEMHQKHKRAIIDYENKIRDGLFRRDEFITKLELELKRLADDKGHVMAQDVLDAFQNKVKKEVDLKKYRDLQVGIKAANPDIQAMFLEFQKADDVGRKYSATVAGLKRSLKAGKINDTEMKMKLYVLDEALKMLKSSKNFTVKNDLIEEENEGAGENGEE